jgi:ATP-dependent RNA helicase DHX8/PRP22
MQIHLSEPPGDILLFLTGQEGIDTACKILFERMKGPGPKVPELTSCPSIPSEVQSKVFEPTPPVPGKSLLLRTLLKRV